MNPSDGGARRWPLLLGAFVTGLTVALLLPGRDGPDEAPAIAPTELPAAGTGIPGPGPTAVRSGVPVGFARSEPGAVAAAASFVCTGQVLLDLDPLSAEEALRELTAAASADDLVRRHRTQLDSARDVLAAGSGPIVYRQSAIAWRVEAFHEDRARVAVWSVGVLSRDGVAPPQAGWSTSTVELLWERGDWRVWGETIAPGPTPIADDSDAPATSEELVVALDGFTDFGSSR